MPAITIHESDCSPAHEPVILSMLDGYARGISGGGKGLSDDVKARLVDEIKKRPGVHVLLAFVDEIPAGLLIAIEGFSSFAARSLLNIHDVYVPAEFRRAGIALALIQEVEALARRLDCCKLTLEVLEKNEPAIHLYEKTGFVNYLLDPSMGKATFMEKKLSTTTA